MVIPRSASKIPQTVKLPSYVRREIDADEGLHAGFDALYSGDVLASLLTLAGKWLRHIAQVPRLLVLVTGYEDILSNGCVGRSGVSLEVRANRLRWRQATDMHVNRVSTPW